MEQRSDTEPSGGDRPDRDDRGRDETDIERLDRNLTDLLTELRVAIPGIQVLFAFLLVAPFNQGWGRLTLFERRLYFGTLLLTAVTALLLIAPTMHHRLLFRMHQKRYLVMTANRLAVIGMTLLAVAMTSAIALITHVEFGGTAVTAIVAGAAAAVFGAVWYAMPLRHLQAAERRDAIRQRMPAP
jgi:hypothetical protein